MGIRINKRMNVLETRIRTGMKWRIQIRNGVIELMGIRIGNDVRKTYDGIFSVHK